MSYITDLVLYVPSKINEETKQELDGLRKGHDAFRLESAQPNEDGSQKAFCSYIYTAAVNYLDTYKYLEDAYRLLISRRVSCFALLAITEGSGFAGVVKHEDWDDYDRARTWKTEWIGWGNSPKPEIKPPD